MDYKKYQYTILCEDKAHYNFVRGWLEQKGAIQRKIALYGELPHEGSGKSFVEKNFADALDKVRRKFKTATTLLIVTLDADNIDINTIVKKLPCIDSDPVFIVITKWSIDTWARFLLDPTHEQALDESKSCKNEFRDKAKFTKLGKQLANTIISSDQNLPKSLRYTIDTIKKKEESLNF